MKTTTVKFILILTISLISNFVLGQCTTSNLYTFTYNGKNYEVIKENKTWIDAATCAVDKGGILVEINDSLEQYTIFNELNSNANITINNTVAPDGGGGAYVWIGGNDLTVEGNWVWDGNNDGNSTQFWLGTSTGIAVAGLYNNWGNEPDDFGGQDALGLSLNGWPLGSAGQWNDVDHTNTLYFIVEYPTTIGVENVGSDTKIKLYPNPVSNFLTIELNEIELQNISIMSSIGQELIAVNKKDYLISKKIDVSTLNNGVYFIKIKTRDGHTSIKKIIKFN